MHIFYCSCHPIRPPLPRLSHSVVCQVERKVKHAPLPELWEWKTQKLQNCSPGQSHILRCWISHDFHVLISILWWCKTQKKEEQRGIKAVGNFHNNFQSAAQKILIFRGGEDLCKHNYIPSSWGVRIWSAADHLVNLCSAFHFLLLERSSRYSPADYSFLSFQSRNFPLSHVQSCWA